MSDEDITKVPVDIERWVESAKANPVLHMQRQATEVVLTAIGLSKTLSDSLVLKGGTLMALAFKSDRATGDVDFTSTETPDDFVEIIQNELNTSIAKSLIKLGYTDLQCRVQKLKKKPRSQNFENFEFPALDITVGYAKKGSNQENLLKEGKSSNVVHLEISFRDQVYNFQELHLFDAHVSVKSFTADEIFAEKLRALIQQKLEHRDRYRRQDIYDLAYLIKNRLDDLDPSKILITLKNKCLGRGINPEKSALQDNEIYERSAKLWDTNKLEVGELPDFSETYKLVQEFYENLPWQE